MNSKSKRDLTPTWTIVLWEEDQKFLVKRVKCEWPEVLEEAKKEYDFYSSYDEFNVTHYTIE